jgi:very-short-patch-repair endonuclease
MSNEKALKLRRNMTDAERALWRVLRDRKDGYRFRRQEPIDHYIVDFVCFKARLVIEVDGGQHSESATDKKRDAYLRSQGFRVLRFWNSEVMSNFDAVHVAILSALSAPTARSPLHVQFGANQ